MEHQPKNIYYKTVALMGFVLFIYIYGIHSADKEYADCLRGEKIYRSGLQIV